MCSSCRGLILANSAAHRIQIQPILFRKLNRCPHAFAKKRWHNNSTLLNL